LLARWPIRNKLLTGLALLLVIVAMMAASGFHSVYAFRSLVKGVGWRMNELPLASELSQRVSDLRVSLRGTSGISDLRAPIDDSDALASQIARLEFRRHLDEVHQALDAYRHQVAQNHEYGSRIDDAQREWQTVYKIDKILADVVEVDRQADWMLTRDEVEQLSGRLGSLQQLVGELPTSLNDSIREFSSEVRLKYRTLIVLTWITTLAVAVMLIVFVHLFYQWVFRPLRILIKGSRKVAGGNFDYRIHLDTRDEMSELADALNDMTARFQAIRDDLDRQVQERTRQVVRSEQLASVGFLAAGVAHEINNPLASIALCAESLEGRMEEFAGADNEQAGIVRDYLRMIQTEAFRCKGITEKLLDFSRLGDQQRQDANLRELVEAVIQMVGHLGRYHGKQVRLSPGPPIYSRVNPQEIKQVVLNLLTNGLDSVDAGGSVEVGIRSLHGQAEITLTDNGCGMTDEVLTHLFEPFFTRKRGGQGTGLGLSISYRIVADHDGHIEASSDGPGKGAQFRVRLPLSQKETHHRYQAA
jgi:signal transduction histidine kinase